MRSNQGTEEEQTVPTSATYSNSGPGLAHETTVAKVVARSYGWEVALGLWERR